MDTKIKLAIDNDDVLFSLGQSFCCDFHNKYYAQGKMMQLHDFSDFDFEKTWGIKPPEVWKREREFYTSSHYIEMPTLPGAQEAIESLSKKYDLHIITSRGKDVQMHTLFKLHQHFKPHHFKGVHHMGPYTPDGAYEPKWKKCKELGAQILIDDYHNTLFTAATHNIHGILFTKPWNKHLTDLPKLIHRVDTWEHVLEKVEIIQTQL